MEVISWPVSDELQHEAANNYRTKYALSLQGRSSLDIIRALTFDGTAPNITISDIEKLFWYLHRNFLPEGFHGIGLEVGAGPLVFSSVLARWKQVSRLYGVEVCSPIIERLFPVIAREVAGPDSEKLIGVVGSFDDMRLPDGSVDFVLDFYSLHHSLDIGVTLREIVRILRPGGFLLMLDKARPDSFSDNDLDALMDQPYGDDYKRQFGLPLQMRLTRRMNGEREYRLKDWRTALTHAGFGRIVHHNLERTKGGSMLWRMFKNIVARFPIPMQVVLISWLPARLPKHRFVLSREGRIYSPALNEFRKDMSMIVAHKL